MENTFKFEILQQLNLILQTPQEAYDFRDPLTGDPEVFFVLVLIVLALVFFRKY